jgi:hypothetical protein
MFIPRCVSSKPIGIKKEEEKNSKIDNHIFFILSIILEWKYSLFKYNKLDLAGLKTGGKNSDTRW